MDNAKAKQMGKEFLYSLPESITGPKGDKAYPLKNIEWCGYSFKKNPDGTIDIKYIRSAMAWALKCLYDHGFLTIRPLLVIASEKKHTNIANETSERVTIETFLDKSDHSRE
ncbi:hypothetical protein DRI50_06925 [candidate division KSB1 bacterium]|nr:MAG: hypothetical protein DRI50_06925 [candidate division KSB1 bacterium]